MPKYYCDPTVGDRQYETCDVYEAESTDVYEDYYNTSDELINITFKKELGHSVFASLEEWKAHRDDAIKRDIALLEQRLLYLEVTLVTPPKIRERKVNND